MDKYAKVFDKKYIVNTLDGTTTYDFTQMTEDVLHDMRAFHMTNGLNKEKASLKVITEVIEFLNK